MSTRLGAADSATRLWMTAAAAIAALFLTVSCLAVISTDIRSGSPAPSAGALRQTDVSETARSPGSVKRRLVMTQIPAHVVDDASKELDTHAGRPRLPLGSRIIAVDPGEFGGEVINLTPEFAAAGRPDVSFDGKHILFVGRRRPADPTGVWEMRGDGSGVRSVIQQKGDCHEAIHLATMFTLNADTPLHQIAFTAAGPEGGTASIYTCWMDGTHVRRITFAPHGVSNPFLLSDGRLLFSMVSDDQITANGADAQPATALFTVNTDGTDVFPFAGLHQVPARRNAPCETVEGEIIYVESGTDSTGGGSLVAVARTRSLRTRRLIATDLGGPYRTPSPLCGGQVLVSHRPVRGERGRTYGVYRLDSEGGGRIAEVYDDPEWDELDAVVLAPHPEPPGRSTVVSDSTTVGQLYCLDAYLSDNLDVYGDGRNRIARVRVTSYAPGHAPASGVYQNKRVPATGAKTVTLGEAVVESDGSFFLDVPARTPLRLETLDRSGTVLQSMRSWIWVMPVERRGCIGCHEDRELTPPNRHVLALRKPPQPIGVEPRKPTGQRRKGYRPRESQ